MQLQHIELDQLTIAKANVRKYRAKKVDDLVPSIEALGIIQPLLVRPTGSGFEIIAGQRRFHALQHIAANQSDAQSLEPIPCLVMDQGDDAKAVEASLAENVARLPMDEIDQYKAFAVLVKQGESVEEIANRFGTTARLVKQRLAIASLIPPILTAYRKDKIQATTLRLLTMATKKQQRAWLELFNASDNHAPEGYALKSWLFGGTSIPVENALFDVTAYDGNIITDLFEEDRYFDDAEKFWPLQSKAIAELKAQYLQDGWSDVVVLDIGEYFPAYEYVDTAKEDGGKIYIVISRDGEVTPYEGQLSRKEIKSAKSKDATEPTKPANSEITKPLQNYLDLHRHSAVRSALLNQQGLALRVATAQIIAGSDLWAIHADPQKATKDATSDSLSDNKADSLFAKERESVLSLLGLEMSDSGTVVPCKSDWQTRRDMGELFNALLELDDEQVSQILTFVIAETLPCGCELVDKLGEVMAVDMRESWQPDTAFFDLLRDKQAINAMLAEVSDKASADAQITATAKVQKQAIQDALGSTDESSTNWLPRYMAFPSQTYRD